MSSFDYRKTWRPLLWEIYSFEAGTGRRVECCHCGKHLTLDEMSIEHLLPMALGGRNEASNLLPSCVPCNNERPCEDVRGKFAHYIQVRLEKALTDGRVMRTGRKGRLQIPNPFHRKRRMVPSPKPHEVQKCRLPIANPVIPDTMLHLILPGKASVAPHNWEQQYEDFG